MAGHSTSAHALFAAAVDDALALVFPVACAGCGDWGPPLCSGCRSGLVPVRQDRVSPGGVAVRAAFSYDGVAASCLRALKEQGRTGLARRFGPPLGDCIRGILEDGDARRALLVPVPTSGAAMRRRGYRVPELLLRRSALPVSRALHLVARSADQKTLSRVARRENVARTMRARGVAGRSVVIVDDVTTTGATIDEAARALGLAGAHVIGAAAAAATPRTHFRG